MDLGTGSLNKRVVWDGFVFPVLNNKMIQFKIFKVSFKSYFFSFFNIYRKPGGEYKFLSGNTSPFLPSPQPLINTTSAQHFASSSSRHEAPHLLASETLERQGKACWLPAHLQTPDFC